MSSEPDEYKSLILGHIHDLVGCFLYYDRKEDEDLPRGVIEQAIKDGRLTIDDMVEEFRKQLTEHLT